MFFIQKIILANKCLKIWKLKYLFTIRKYVKHCHLKNRRTLL
jgi:hypothetical protein